VHKGGWHVLLATGVLSGGTEAAGPASTAARTGGVVGKAAAAQVQVARQSASLVQVVTFTWLVPGYEVEVVQTGVLPALPSGSAGGSGTGTVSPPDPPPVPDAALPPADPGAADPVPGEPGVDPEHVVVPTGWQTNPSPQSASRLHGNCHR
jgi:hypothetical protein